MAASTINVLSLFSGVGGLDLAIRLALPAARVVCYVEGEVPAAEILAARLADGSLDDAPVWSDVRTFDCRPWRGVVDLVAGGFPCQDISCAGKGAGLAGQRSGLWYEFHRVIREVGPRLVFVENVRALLGRGLDAVLGGLAELGYDAEWCVLSAGAVGAPHRRERVFILGWLADAAQQPEREQDDEGRAVAREDARLVACGGGVRVLADADHAGPQGRSVCGCGRADERATRSGGLPLFPPGPAARGEWGRILADHPDLAPATQPAVRRMDDGMAARLDRLRACGNGVVAVQGAAALVLLARRAGLTTTGR